VFLQHCETHQFDYSFDDKPALNNVALVAWTMTRQRKYLQANVKALGFDYAIAGSGQEAVSLY